MAYIINMPKLGLEMEEGVVLEWYVDPGDEVAEGDLLVEVESEKSIGEVDAREDGAVRRIYIEEGEAVPPGTPIGILGAPDADISDLAAEAAAELDADAAAELDTDAAEDEGPGEAELAESTTASAASEAGGASDSATGESAGAGETKASPRARARAEELGVDLAAVEGTGFEGAVTEDDVEAAAETGGSAEEAGGKASPRARARAEELGVTLATVEGTGYEGAITEDDVEAAAEVEEAAKAEAAAEVDTGIATAEGDDRYARTTAVADPAAGESLLETMEAVGTAFEERVTLTDVVTVVASAALADHPVVNGTYAEATHQVQTAQHIALVADVEGELCQGVIENVEERSLTEIVEARQGIDGSRDEPTPTFTLANTAEADPGGRLVNPPAVAALTVDATGQRAVPTEEGVDLQPLVTTSLTYDTRAVGEAEARAFLDAILARAEEASALVLGSYRGQE